MKRFFDIFAVVALAVVLLMPRPGVEVKAAVEKLDRETEQRIAELQAALLGDPGDLEAAIAVAEIYRTIHRPEWALATLGPFRERAAGDYRVYFGIAMAQAERFELPDAHDAMGRALAACAKNAGKVPCGAAPEARMRMVQNGLQRVIDSKIDPRKRPEVVAEAMFGSLRATRIEKIRTSGKPSGPPAKGAPAPR
ncbi:MAG: hypothetical protein HY906_12720 [Deltaproteobacteria bacterium]|nr:hypothetical protein [Deltaproteobacteria bacterium]